MTRQNTRTIRIHNLHLVIRDCRDKALVPAHSKMYSPASLVTVLNCRVRHHHCGVSFASFVTGAGNRSGRIGISRARHSTCFVYQDQGTRPFIPHFRAQRSSVLLFVARRQAGMKSSLKGVNGGPMKCIHLARRVPHASARKAFSGLDWRKAE
jgi:hypothetical protein